MRDVVCERNERERTNEWNVVCVRVRRSSHFAWTVPPKLFSLFHTTSYMNKQPAQMTFPSFVRRPPIV